MRWEKVSNYCIRCGDYRVAKVIVNGEARYECWKNPGPKRQMLGWSAEASEAKSMAEQDARKVA